MLVSFFKRIKKIRICEILHKKLLCFLLSLLDGYKQVKLHHIYFSTINGKNPTAIAIDFLRQKIWKVRSKNAGVKTGLKQYVNLILCLFYKTYLDAL